MSEQGLFLLDLDINELDYTKFITSWLYLGEEGNFLMDPGPKCTIPTLLSSLEKKEVKELHWILLTHIHLDHGGGIGHIVERFPDAKVVCHEKAVRHLIDPQRLWDGSKKVLGHVADVYGEILSVPEENIHVLENVPFGEGIEVIPTPGHASHHQCYAFKDWFFPGELFGLHVPMAEGLYLRPATPPRFVLKEYIESMEKVVPHLREKMCFAHYGIYHDAKEVLVSSREQLRTWVEVIDEKRESSDVSKIIDALIEKDELYARFRYLEPSIQKREKNFSEQSIRGIIQYLEGN